MSFGRNDAVPPQEPHRSGAQHHFTPQAYEQGARRIEQGISAGQGTEALHQELSMMREAAMQNGQFNLAQYRQDVRAIDAKLHADGFLPRVHIDVDGQGHDIVRRGGAQMASAGDMQPGAPEAPQGGRHWGGGRNFAPRHHHGGRGHGGHGGFHGRRGHHRRGGGAADAGPQNPGDGSFEGGAPENVAGGESLQENELRPQYGNQRGGYDQNPGGGDQYDRTNARFGRGQEQGNPFGQSDNRFGQNDGRDRSRQTDQLNLWGAPTISAAGIDKVLRENHSPAAGMGSYIYDAATSRGINPAFALAMYGQESTFGTRGAAVRNNSFGNIRPGSGHGFKRYGDIREGIDDWMNLMTKDRYNGKPLHEVLRHYAPNSDGNNERRYAANVTNNMAKWARMNDGGYDNRSYA